MIEHIVLFRWAPEATEEQIGHAMAGLRALKSLIPGIADLTCGENFSERAEGYTHGLVVRFGDRAALEAYGPHPSHRHVVENFINPIRAGILAFDFEIKD